MRDTFDEDFVRYYIEGEGEPPAPPTLKRKSAPIKRRKPKNDYSLYYQLGQFVRKAIDETIAPLKARIAELESSPTKFVGVWTSGTEFAVRSIVSHGGSMWHANEDTKDKPGTSTAWTLCCKRGKDGRDAT